MADFLLDLESVLTPQPKGEPMNAFTQAPSELNQRAANVNEKGTKAIQVLDDVESTLLRVADERKKAAADTNQVVQKVAEQSTATTTQLLEEAGPLFEKRRAIQDRQEEIRDMNPFARAIKGLFNRNYNEGYLKKVEGDTVESLQTVGQELTMMSSLYDRLLQTRATSDAAMEDVRAVDESTAQLKGNLALQQLSLARQHFGDAVNELEGQASLARTQILLKEKKLSEMTPGDINAAMGGLKDGKAVVIDGVELTRADLQERQRQLNIQLMTEQSAKLSLTSQAQNVQLGAMNLAEARKGMMLSNMNLEDVKAALNNNGQFRGIQLDVVQLQSRAKALAEGAQVEAEIGTMGSQTNAAIRMIQNSGTLVEGFTNRMQGVFGRDLPPQMTQFVAEYTSRMSDIAESIRRLPKGTPGTQAAVVQAGRQTADLMKQMDAVIDNVVTRSTGNKDIQMAVRSWITGQDLTPDQASQSLLAIARGGGLPPGVRLNAVASKSVAEATAALARLEKNPDYQRGSEAEKKRMELSAVREAASKQWVGAYTERAVQDLPDLAKKMGDPFGTMDKQSFLSARSRGDDVGLERIAAVLGLNPDQARTMFAKDDASIWNSVKERAASRGITDLQAAKSQLTAMQTSAWLESMESIQPGSAKAFANFMNRDDVQSLMARTSERARYQGLSESIIDSAAAGQIQGRLGSAAQLIQTQASVNERQRLLVDANRYQAYGSDPLKRVTALLAVNPNLTPQEEAALMRVITQKFGAQNRTPGQAFVEGMTGGSNAYEAMEAESGRAEGTYLAVANFIKNTKFEDPGLERIRKVAAKDWDSHARNADAVVERLAKGQPIEPQQ